MKPIRNYRTAATASVLSILLAGVSGTALAENAPAVSKLNGKAALAGTFSDDDTTDELWGGLLLGSVTAPLGHEFGFQADGLVGTRDGDTVAGIGGHLFWRDPANGLVGVTASYLDVNNDGAIPDQSVTRFGGEAEYYAETVTIALHAGIQDGDNVDDGFYGSAIGYWYPNDNLRLNLGASNDPSRDTMGLAGVEFQPGFAAAPGMTFFVDAAAGKDSYVNLLAGVRFYFGDDKSLKLRNRADDPIVNLPGTSLTETPVPGNTCPSGSVWYMGKCVVPG
ncbi:MAG: hypothetical protein KF899_06505 [Parvibaculum sp.]|nr:hypothetical protein [Parvibaculum sp.]